MAFMKIRKSDGTLLDLLFFKGDKGDKGDSAKFSYGDTLPDTMEDGEIFFKTDGADYIVEQGTSGIWTYRKWNSGIAECWGTTTSISVAMGALGDALYGNTSAFQPITFPFEFIEPPTVTVSLACAGETYTTWLSRGSSSTTTTTATGTYGVYRTGSETPINVSACYHAIGRWK